MRRDFWSKWRKKKKALKKWENLFLLLQLSLLPFSNYFNTEVHCLFVATLLFDTLMAHSISSLMVPWAQNQIAVHIDFFSHPIQTSQLPPQSVGGGETSLLSRTNVCSQHCSWNNSHAALSFFHLLLLGLRKWKQGPQRTLDKSEE